MSQRIICFGEQCPNQPQNKSKDLVKMLAEAGKQESISRQHTSLTNMVWEFIEETITSNASQTYSLQSGMKTCLETCSVV